MDDEFDVPENVLYLVTRRDAFLYTGWSELMAVALDSCVWVRHLEYLRLVGWG